MLGAAYLLRISGAPALRDPERWQRARDVLHEAMQLDGDERSDFLDSQCAGDPLLRAELNELLAAEGELGSSFLEEPAIASIDQNRTFEGVPVPH